MPTFEDPAADAAEAQQALRGPAHATRRIEDPSQVYAILGSLSAGVASLGQALHQIADFHDSPARKAARVTGDSDAGQATAYRVSWEIHRAGEIIRQVAGSIDHAHEAEARIAYQHGHFPALPDAPQPSSERGLGL